MLNTDKIAESFASDLGIDRWLISYDNETVSVKHLRPTTVVTGIEIYSAVTPHTVITVITLNTVSGNFTSKVNCKTYDDVKLVINDLVELAIEHHMKVVKRLRTFSEDLG